MRNLTVVFAFVLTICSAFSQEKVSFLEKLDQNGYGKISGRIQTLFMGRHFSESGSRDRDLHSGTTAATLNYISPKVGGFSFGLQYIYAWKFYSVGNREAFGNQDPAYVLSNSDYSLLK